MPDVRPGGEGFQRIADSMADRAATDLGQARARAGADRFTAFVEAHGELQAMAFFLVLSMSRVMARDYSDASLDAIRIDAQDLRDAAEKLAGICDQLADTWQAQRDADPERWRPILARTWWDHERGPLSGRVSFRYG